MKEIAIPGKIIAERRKMKGFSQESLADESGISLRTIQRIENNQVRPQPFTLKKLAEVLDLDIESMVEPNINLKGAHLIKRTFLVSILQVVPVVFNVIIPLIFWKQYKEADRYKALVGKFITSQILITVLMLISFWLAPQITYMLVGETNPGNFFPSINAYFLLLFIDIMSIIIASIQFSQGNKTLFDKFPNLL